MKRFMRRRRKIIIKYSKRALLILLLYIFTYTIMILSSEEYSESEPPQNSTYFDLRSNQTLMKIINKMYWKYVRNKGNHFMSKETVAKDRLWLLDQNLWSMSGDGNNSELMEGVDGYYDKLLPQLTWTMNLEHSPFLSSKQKTIVIFESFKAMGFNQTEFSKSCPVLSNSCRYLNGSVKRYPNVDAVLFIRNWFYNNNAPVSEKTTRIYYTLESSVNSNVELERTNDILSSFWRGSHITTPYGKWVYYDEEKRQAPSNVNFAKGKTKLIAIFTSNCFSNNDRMGFVTELKKYVPVDVYGHCGNLVCSKKNGSKCLDMLKSDYKFYLAFENSNCRDYITEKVFNALKNNIVPIVLGAHPTDYKDNLPENSYISIEDFPSVEMLANYIKYLDSNDTEYNKYFRWKGTGEMIEANYFCQLCAMLHYSDSVNFPQRKNTFYWQSNLSLDLCRSAGYKYWFKNDRFVRSYF